MDPELIISLPKLYTSDGCSYEGMDEETVTHLRTELNRETTYITKEEFDILIQAQQRI
jgi:hypothetical protein